MLGILEILVLLIAALFWLVISGVIMLGVNKMRRLESYGLAVTASVLAMLPCHPGFIIGLPIGLWTLMVLLRPEVRAAFESARFRDI